MLDENGVEIPDINQAPDPEENTKKDNRFKDLADKVKATAEERDKATKEAEEAKKEASFYKGFSTLVSKPQYAAAGDYQDKIKEKVMAGYDPEDATISILAKEGKLGQAPAPTRKESPMGGSATTAIRNEGEKPTNEMSHAEKREMLEQMERESGAVTNFLRHGL